MKKESTIIKLLNEKSATKQLVYSNTKEVFNDLVNALKNKHAFLIALSPPNLIRVWYSKAWGLDYYTIM
jgi:hypothetical protein